MLRFGGGGGSSGIAAGDSPTWTGQHTFAKGTITTSTPFTETQTWNSGAVTFTAHTINVTDTASASASLLMDLQVGGVTKLNVTKAGRVISADGAFLNASSSGIFASGGSLYLYANTGSPLNIDASQNINFSTNSSLVGWSDARFYRNAAGVIEINNGTTGTYRDLYARSILGKSSTGGIGYGSGAGGAVTQATSRTTGVTLNNPTGAITLVSAAGSTTEATFTVTNSTVAATDTVNICQKSGTDKYIVMVSAVAAGSFDITFRTFSGTTTEQPVFNFAVIKAVAA